MQNESCLYHYWAFGLRIDSEIELPEMFASDQGSADVTIHHGTVPEHPEPDGENIQVFRAAADEVLLYVNGIAYYYLTAGDSIIVQPCADVEASRVRFYLMEIIGLLLIQRRILLIHGSTVVVNGQAYIFTGASGAGKSTIAAALRKQGYPLLADDISALARDADGIFRVRPGYRIQKLGQASTDMLGIRTDGYARVPDERQKYVVIEESGFWHQPVPVAAVFELGLAPGEEVSAAALTGTEKLGALLRNTYLANYIERLGWKRGHFEQCAQLAKQVAVYRLRRPETGVTVGRQIEQVLKVRL